MGWKGRHFGGGLLKENMTLVGSWSTKVVNGSLWGKPVEEYWKWVGQVFAVCQI